MGRCKVLSLLEGQALDESCSVKTISQRTVVFALAQPSRSADLSKLNLKPYCRIPEGAVFYPSNLAKQSEPGKSRREFLFPCFSENNKICPVASLEFHVCKSEASQLCISFIKLHWPVTSSAIARWLKEVIQMAGIDTSIFKAHSVRGATTSAAANLSITTNEILEAADWTSDTSFTINL